MSCKAALYTALTTATTVAAGGVIPLGQIVRRFGNAIRVDGNTITLLEPGYYDITINATVQPTAATPITAQITENGVPVAGGSVTATPAAAGDSTPIQIPDAIVRVYCRGTKLITVTLSEGASVVGSAVSIVKV